MKKEENLHAKLDPFDGRVREGESQVKDGMARKKTLMR